MRAGVGRDEDRAVNPTLARTLLALSYPLRMTAHLTQSPMPRRSDGGERA
jgi:hypothetical protein